MPPAARAHGHDLGSARFNRAELRPDLMRLVAALCFGMLCTACGTGGAAAARHAPSATTTPSATPTAALAILTAQPDTRLRAGELLLISVAGFPRFSTVSVYECLGGVSARGLQHCGAASTPSILYTGASGRAHGQLVADPAVEPGTRGHLVRCVKQCRLIASIIKRKGRAPNSPVTITSVPLGFTSRASNGLSGSALQDMSWVSSSNGWALASLPCAAGTCAQLAHTTDGGRHWVPVATPRAVFQDGSANCAQEVCVSDVAFATPAVGFLFGPGLLVTTNGGRTWRDDPGLQTEALAVAGGRVYRIVYRHTGCPGPCMPALESTSVSDLNWQTEIQSLDTPDRNDSATIAGSGSTVLVALYGSQAGPVSAQATVYRSTDAGQSWQRQQDPCLEFQTNRRHEEDLIDLTVAPNDFAAGLCTPHVQGQTFAVTSTDGGSSWRREADLPSHDDLAQIASASSSSLAVSTTAITGNGPFSARLFVSTDSGQRWSRAATDNQQVTQDGVPAWLGFQSPQVGTWISGPQRYWRTVDSGRTWMELDFP